VIEPRQFRARPRWWSRILQEVTRRFRLPRQGTFAPIRYRPWVSERPDKNGATRSLVGAEETSVLSRLAFTSLWLLVFAMPWEDAITISGFGTGVRLIGMVAVGFGVLAIIERGKIRRPAAGHIVMGLFVLLAALSYMWSLYPEGTLTQTYSYIQLFAMVWLIWELAPRVRDQMRLMQAYVLGTFVSGIDTIYLFLSHQESVYHVMRALDWMPMTWG